MSMAHFRTARIRLALIAALVVLVSGVIWFVNAGSHARRLYRLAEEALAVHDFRAASRDLDEYLALRPSDADGLLLAAHAARRGGDFGTAEKRLGTAEANGVDAKALARERELLRVQAGDVEEAERLVRLCERDPKSQDSAVMLEALAEGGLRALDRPLAVWCARTWLETRPGKLDQARGLIWRGRLREWQNDYPGALVDFRRAAELAPAYVPARVRVAYGVLREDPHEATAELTWLLEHAARDPDVRLLTARWRRALGDTEKAARLLDELLAEYPDEAAVLIERGRVALDLNRAAEAERWLLHAAEAAPEEREVNLALGDWHRLSGRPGDATRHYVKARTVDAPLESAPKPLVGSGKRKAS
ncbi:MAG: tetratricopeptide repeat protein [Gemmataceae bacterium]